MVKDTQRYTRDHCSGFTLIELVAVMVLLGGLGATLLPRFAHHEATLPAQADQVARILRRTQALAMAQGRTLTFEIVSATNYAITDGVSPIRDPAGEVQYHNLYDQTTFTAGADILFDSLGRPRDALGLVSSARSWVLNGSATISVEPVTGFVSVSP